MYIFFDLDGVLLDNEKPALELWRKYLPETKVNWLWEMCLGISSKDEFECFKSHLGYTRQQYNEFVENVKILPRVRSGAVEVLFALKQQGHILYLVTSSSKNSVDKKLRYCDLGHFFESIITADDVTKSKPYSEPYELAYFLANGIRDRIFVIEDSISGVFSAYNAKLTNIIFYEDTVKCPLFFEDSVQNITGDFRQVLDVIQKAGK